jgi:hypothetical protein
VSLGAVLIFAAILGCTVGTGSVYQLVADRGFFRREKIQREFSTGDNLSIAFA